MANRAKKATKAHKKSAAEAEVENYRHEEAKRKNIPTAELQKLVPDDDKAIKVDDGRLASVTREPEVIRAFRDTWNDGINSYLNYFRDRLVIARDLLSQEGSVFVQISDENVHRVRSIMDEVFGVDSFVVSIVVKKKGSQIGNTLEAVNDYILWYGRNAKSSGFIKIRSLFTVTEDEEILEDYNVVELPQGERTRIAELEDRDNVKYRENFARFRTNYPDAKLVALNPLKSGGFRRNQSREFYFQGKRFPIGSNQCWKHTVLNDAGETPGMERLAHAGRLFPLGNDVRFVRYAPAPPIKRISNWWDSLGGASAPVYVVQTNPELIKRCILMTTDPGDLVLDPTCGSGTTAYVAEQWGRRWITIDTSRVALTLARSRLMGARYDFYLLRDSEAGAAQESETERRPIARGTFTNNIRQGFVLERARWNTSGSIANNAEIDVIWERWQKTLEPLRERLNFTLGRKSSAVMPGLVPGIHDLSPAAGQDVDGRNNPRIKSGDGHDDEQKAWEEWEIPREPDETWPEEAKTIHAQWWEARRTRQKEIDDSIARNADVEYLYDRPYKARGIVRVAGPFTVESLSPHRVLPMGEDPYLEELLSAGEDPSSVVPGLGPGIHDLSHSAKKDVDGRDKPGHDEGGDVDGRDKPGHDQARAIDGRNEPRIGSGDGHVEKGGPVTTDFARVVYENLKAAGVQNTKKGETLKFEWLRPFASRSGLIQFEGRYMEKGESKRAAICIGPEYDTVGYELVRRAAREAADLFDTLIICGFAFAPEVDDTRLNLGALTVLKARMNQDLRMADKLKATGAGNLFVVFGEPDIVIHKRAGDMLQVEIRGMDIFDPTTGEVRSSGGKELMNDVAAWFIDDDYDEESFFVRQAYFVGNDPYEGLKRALKAEIDETAWAELNSTISRPFPKPKRGRICVKVINHFGDEVQKVYWV